MVKKKRQENKNQLEELSFRERATREDNNLFKILTY